jgi:hypothetical protein
MLYMGTLAAVRRRVMRGGEILPVWDYSGGWLKWLPTHEKMSATQFQQGAEWLQVRTFCIRFF